MTIKWVFTSEGAPGLSAFGSTQGLGTPIGINTLTDTAYYDKPGVGVTPLTGGGGGGGTVTSVAVSSTDLSVSGSPITTSGTFTLNVANNAITYAKMQDISAASRLLGRGSAAGAGDPQEISIGTGLSLSGTTLSSTAGVQYWTEATTTASLNSSIGATSWQALSSLADADAVILPKGTGALQTQIADGTATAGNKRGLYAIDFQTTRTAATQVAAGTRSFIGNGNGNRTTANTTIIGCGTGNLASDTNAGVFCGQANTASGVNSVIAGGGGSGAGNSVSGPSAGILAGELNTVSGSQAWALGGTGNSVTGTRAGAMGSSGVADGAESVTCGVAGNALGIANAFSHGAGTFGAGGYSHFIDLPLRCNTTDATQTTLATNASAIAATNQLTLLNSSAMAFQGQVIARQNTTGDVASWKFEGTIKRGANAAATAMVGSATVTALNSDAGAASWALAVDADTTIGCLRIRFTGEAAKTIRVSGWLRATQTTL